jgi:hypothetical protein
MRKSKGARIRAKSLKIAARTKEKAADSLGMLIKLIPFINRKFGTAIKRSHKVVITGLEKLCMLLDNQLKKKKEKKSKVVKGGKKEKENKEIRKNKKSKKVKKNRE